MRIGFPFQIKDGHAQISLRTNKLADVPKKPKSRDDVQGNIVAQDEDVKLVHGDFGSIL